MMMDESEILKINHLRCEGKQMICRNLHGHVYEAASAMQGVEILQYLLVLNEEMIRHIG